MALPEHREWVRHDLTDAGWRWRSVGRILAQALPFALILALLPGPLSLRLSVSGFLLVASALTATVTAEQFRDRRLRQHGYAPPTPSE